MASITIRNLKDETKKRLRLRAAENGRSLEAEARDVLDRNVLETPLPGVKTGLDLFRGLMAVAEKYGGFDLEPFPDQTIGEPRAFRRPKKRK